MQKKEILIWGIIILVFVVVIGGVSGFDKYVFNKEKIDLKAPITDADWTLGPKNAKVQIVEYSDFQCPACAVYYFPFKKVLEKYQGSILFAYRHFPLNIHDKAIIAAYYSEAAGKQGKFWEMADILFVKQAEWSKLTKTEEINSVLLGYAKSLGLNEAQITADIKSEEFIKQIDAKIDENMKTGEEAGLVGTPTYYINGMTMKAPTSEAELEKIIKKAIEDNK